MLQLLSVAIDKPDTTNFILGQTHFIKSVEDIHEALVGAVPGIRFGLAFCEASGKRLVRHSGTGAALTELACRNALAIGAGHCFLVFLGDGFYPLNVLNAIKAVPEVCRISARPPIRPRSSSRSPNRDEAFSASSTASRRSASKPTRTCAGARICCAISATRRSRRASPRRHVAASCAGSCGDCPNRARLRACVLAGLRAVRRLRIADCLLSIVDRRLPLRHGVPVRFASRRRAHAIHDIGTAASGRLASHDNAAAAPTPPRLRFRPDSGPIPARLRLDSGSMPARFRRDRTGAGNAHRTRPSASHDPVYGESAGSSNAPFSAPPKHRPAPRFAPRPPPDFD